MKPGVLAASSIALMIALSACGRGGIYADVAPQAQYIATRDIAQADGATIVRPGMTMGVLLGPTIIATPVGRGPCNATGRSTTIDVQIKRQADGSQLREGRASKTGTAGSQETTLTWAVPALAVALFRGFPGQPGVTQQVRL